MNFIINNNEIIIKAFVVVFVVFIIREIIPAIFRWIYMFFRGLKTYMHNKKNEKIIEYLLNYEDDILDLYELKLAEYLFTTNHNKDIKMYHIIYNMAEAILNGEIKEIAEFSKQYSIKRIYHSLYAVLFDENNYSKVIDIVKFQIHEYNKMYK